MQHQTLEPLALQERIQTIDIIRGFALFGVIIITFTVDNGSNAPWQGWSGFGDQLVYWILRFLIDDKFVNIYCILFGLGFAIQMQRAESSNSPFTLIFVRRLISLYLIGVACIIMLGIYNIIFIPYAITGLLLLFFRKLSLNLILIVAFLFFMAPWVKKYLFQQKIHSALSQAELLIDSTGLKKYEGVYGKNPRYRTIIIAEKNSLRYKDHWGEGVLTALSMEKFISKKNKDFFTFNNKSSDSITGLKLQYSYNGMVIVERKVNLSIEEAKEELAESEPVMQKKENYGQFILKNILYFGNEFSNWSWKNFLWFNFTGTTSFLFLTGMYAGRRRLFNNIASNYKFFLKLRFWCLLFGIVLTSIFLGRSALKYVAGANWKPLPDLIGLLIQFSWTLGCVLVAIGIIAALSLALETEKWKKKLAFLIPVGRLGLTNYILGNLFYFLIFTNWGLGMSGKVGGFYGLLIIIPICFVIYFFSNWWLKFFRYGPFEWLWRSLTYLKFQPMRLKASEKKEA